MNAPGTCVYCGCTETTPCEGGCAWADDSQTLCTVCLGAGAVAIELIAALGIVAAKPDAKLRLTKPSTFDALDIEAQRQIVGTCRRWLDAIQLHVAGELGERAIANGEELDVITAFLLEHCPEELARVPDQSLGQVVIRLLEPQVGRRIVLPGARV
jgi:hypothetical protein